MIHPADTPLRLYLNHKSPTRKLSTALKLIIVIAFLLLTGVLVDTWLGGAIALTIATVAYAVAKIPPMVAFWQLRGTVITLTLLSPPLRWHAGGGQALTTLLALLAVIVVATLLTLTTRVSDIMDTLTTAMQPFVRFGLPVNTVALALLLTLRMIPFQVMAAAEVLEARRARGTAGLVVAFDVLVAIRIIDHSKAIGGSLIARGEDE